MSAEAREPDMEDQSTPAVISLDRWTKERRAQRIADWLEEIAGHIRAGRTVVVPDRVLLVLQSGNAPEGSGDFECLHLGLTPTMIGRTHRTLREREAYANAERTR